MERQEWLRQIRQAFGLDHGVGEELDFEYVARFWSYYGSDYCYDFGYVGQALEWAWRSGRFSGLLVSWLRQQSAEEVAELLAGLLAGYDRSAGSQGVVRFAWEQWQPRAEAAFGC